MNREIWQRLLGLESRDVTQRRFFRIHGRRLNARRAREINAATRQAHEYFTNAERSEYSVRPLLTFYGVTSLSRALLLLLRTDGGEEGLKPGHGLETVGWGMVMSGDTSRGLRRLSRLSIRTCSGLFNDFMKHTRNRMALHVRSGAVDWRVHYDLPSLHEEMSVDHLFSRLPDLREEYSEVSNVSRCAAISEVTYSKDNGLMIRVRGKSLPDFRATYGHLGYSIVRDPDSCILRADSGLLENEPPLFVHSYLHKMFGAIPILFIAEPLSSGSRYSQLCTTYMVSYILGMLVRYYPTHWMALVQGQGGDVIWPAMHHAQQMVEQCFPEMVAEIMDDAVATGHPIREDD